MAKNNIIFGVFPKKPETIPRAFDDSSAGRSETFLYIPSIAEDIYSRMPSGEREMNESIVLSTLAIISGKPEKNCGRLSIRSIASYIILDINRVQNPIIDNISNNTHMTEHIHRLPPRRFEQCTTTGSISHAVKKAKMKGRIH